MSGVRAAHAGGAALSRRHLLAAAAAGGAAVVTSPLVIALAGRTGRPSWPASLPPAPAHLRRQAWQPLIGAVLAAETEHGARERLRLDRLRDPQHGWPDPERAFVLSFAPLAGPPPVDGLRQVDHPRLGRVPLWLGTVGPDGPARRLEAVVLAAPLPLSREG